MCPYGTKKTRNAWRTFEQRLHFWIEICWCESMWFIFFSYSSEHSHENPYSSQKDTSQNNIVLIYLQPCQQNISHNITYLQRHESQRQVNRTKNDFLTLNMLNINMREESQGTVLCTVSYITADMKSYMITLCNITRLLL